MKVSRVGLDLAKQVFQVHAVDERGEVVERRRLKRRRLLAWFAQQPPCEVVMEACGGAHHWGRELVALGHRVKLLSPQHVTPYRRGGKNDGNDAEAICEAGSRPRMPEVALKTVEQQDLQALHRVRERIVRERTGLSNQLRGLLAEYGIVVGQGLGRLRRALPEVLEDPDNGLSGLFRELLAERAERLRALDGEVAHYDAWIARLASEDPVCRRLQTVPGVGPLTATALVAAVGNGRAFRNGRQMAAWLGLVPRQHSSGSHQVLLGITKHGDVYLRKLLVHGARAALVRAASRPDRRSQWACALKARRGHNRACVALANKQARVLWSLLAHGTEYRETA